MTSPTNAEGILQYAVDQLVIARDELRAEVGQLKAERASDDTEIGMLRTKVELRRRERDELRAKVDDLTNAATTAKNLLSRKHPHSVADVDGDAWEAWAVLEAALVSDKEC